LKPLELELLAFDGLLEICISSPGIRSGIWDLLDDGFCLELGDLLGVSLELGLVFASCRPCRLCIVVFFFSNLRVGSFILLLFLLFFSSSIITLIIMVISRVFMLSVLLADFDLTFLDRCLDLKDFVLELNSNVIDEWQIGLDLFWLDLGDLIIRFTEVLDELWNHI